MRKHLNIKITGKVQGVNFRYEAKILAEQLGIFGFADNRPDGSVYIEAEGDEVALGQFLEWCKEGTLWSEVDSVESEEGEMEDYSEFKVS